MPNATAMETSGLDAQLALFRGALPLAILRRGTGSLGQVRVWPDVVARGLHRPDQLASTRDGRVDGHGGPLRGEVHRCVQHTVGLPQESLDAVHARSAGHPLDIEHDVDGRRGRRGGTDGV